jgi:hypothetical protein
MDNRYPYSSYIKSPKQLGASPKGTIAALKKDIRILGDYIDVLTTGSSRAQSVKGPMGNKYFLATDTDCKDTKGVAHPRYIFVNNIPSTTLGGGLVPGVVQDVMYVNPSKLFAAFSQSDVCRLVTMETRDISNIVQTESQYVLDDDLADYPASWFPKGVHPIKNEPTESASSGKDKKKKNKKENFTTEPELPETIYYISVGIIGIYLILKFIEKPLFRKLIKLSKI